MYVSARERMILQTLLSLDRETTVKEISDELGVSERTVHRDLKGVESILKKYHAELKKKAGVGIQIIGNEDHLEQLQLMLYRESPVEFTPEERQTLILCSLLEADEPIKLTTLAKDLNVTMVTVSNDLNKLQERLQSFELFINKKRGYGVEITGTEAAKRKAMGTIISENLDEVEFLALVKENIQKQTQYQASTLSEKLLGLVEKNKLVIVEKVIEEVNLEKDYSIADSAYIGLVVHIALAIERIQHGENIKIDPNFLLSLRDSPEYQIAGRIVEKLAGVFGLDIPEAEVGYISMHLQGSKLRRDKEYLVDDKSFEASGKASLLIKYVEKALNCRLSNDFSLFSGLVTHLEPAIYRIERNMGIQNSLLEKIKEDYKELFDVIKKGVKVVFPDLTVPDEEIGFLVLHFGSALLTSDVKLKALIICSTGIGTSKILATRLLREFPELKDLKNASLFELENLEIDEYDLVISTIKLPNFSRDYILVSPILTEEEINKIRVYMLDKKAKRGLKDRLKSAPSMSHGFIDVPTTIENMAEVKSLSNTILDILQNFKVKVARKGNVKDVLTEVCLDLEKSEVIGNVPFVVKALLDREKLGGLGIPGSELALFHTRNSHILKPAFLVVSLRKALEVNSMAKNAMEMKSILLLLAPDQISSLPLEVLSHISAMIIESKESMAVFESKNERLIQSYLAKKLNELFWQKMTEMRE